MPTTLAIPADLRDQLKAIAQSEKRSLSNLVVVLITLGLNQWAQQTHETEH